MDFQGYDISAARELIPKLQQVLITFRSAGFPVYHTREGKLELLTYSLLRTNMQQATDPIYQPFQPEKHSGHRITHLDSESAHPAL